MTLAYDERTGTFTRRKTGRPAGSRTGEGYIEIRVNGRRYYAHRIAWLMVTGEWPKYNIDHINGDRADNRFANLRDVSQSVNRQNVKKAKGRSGYVGVSWHEGDQAWRARITLPGEANARHIGSFKTAEEARDAYLAAKATIHPAVSA